MIGGAIALINASLVVFRETDVPEYDPDFTVPLYPFTPIAGFVLSLALVYFMDAIEIGLGVLFVVFAVVWYFAYARNQTDLEGLLGRYVRDRSGEMPDAAVTAASAVQPTDPGESGPQVMVALSNPRTERPLITLASALAAEKGGSVLATHVVQVPDQTPLESSADHIGRIDAGRRPGRDSYRRTRPRPAV